MAIKSISTTLLAGSTLLFSASAGALTVNEYADFSQYVNRADFVGVLDQGVNTISGSLFTTCVATTDEFPDCSSGDQIDNIRWALPNGNWGITKAYASITGFHTTGKLQSEDFGLGVASRDGSNSDAVISGNSTLSDLMLRGSTSYSFAIASSVLIDDFTGEIVQGTGDLVLTTN